MNKFCLLIAAAILLISCGSDAGFKINGTTPDINNGTNVFLQRIDANNQLQNIDTTVIKEGKFSFNPEPVSAPEMMVLTFESARGNVILIAENEEITVKAYKDSLYTSEVNGGAEMTFLNSIMTMWLHLIKRSKNYNKKGWLQCKAATRQK